MMRFGNASAAPSRAVSPIRPALNPRPNDLLRMQNQLTRGKIANAG
jgi:hypothetical protein